MAIIPKPGVDEVALSVLDAILVDVNLVNMIFASELFISLASIESIASITPSIEATFLFDDAMVSLLCVSALSVLDAILVDVILVDMILLRLDIKMFINKVRLVI